MILSGPIYQSILRGSLTGRRRSRRFIWMSSANLIGIDTRVLRAAQLEDRVPHTHTIEFRLAGPSLDLRAVDDVLGMTTAYVRHAGSRVGQEKHLENVWAYNGYADGHAVEWLDLELGLTFLLERLWAKRICFGNSRRRPHNIGGAVTSSKVSTAALVERRPCCRDLENLVRTSTSTIASPPDGTILIWDPVYGVFNSDANRSIPEGEPARHGWVPLDLIPIEDYVFLGQDWDVWASPRDASGAPSHP